MSRPSGFGSPSGPELTAALVDTVTHIRELNAEVLDLLAAMDAEHVASDAGYSSLAAYVCEATHMSRPAANRMVARAAQVAETVTPTGHVTPAALPHTRDALREGVLDGDHLDAIVDTVKELPASAPAALRELFDQTLADTARTSSPHTVRQHGRVMLQRLDQDGTLPADEKTVTGNELHLQRTRDGGSKFRGRLDQAATEELVSVLGPLAKPTSPVPGVPDPRSEAERNGDGLAAIVHLVVSGGSAPEQGGEKPHLNLVMSVNDFLAGTGIAIADGGSLFCPQSVLQAACDAKIVRILLDEQRRPLDVGTTQRTVTVQQRKALVVRDQGCAFPHCHLPARWTDAHHLVHWKDGGPTDVDNLVLLCRRHHTMLHKTEWIILMQDGIPFFRPPKWVDPQQKLIRNVLRL